MTADLGVSSTAIGACLLEQGFRESGYGASLRHNSYPLAGFYESAIPPSALHLSGNPLTVGRGIDYGVKH